MANELKISFLVGRVVGVMVLNSVGQFWNSNTSAFENYSATSLTNGYYYTALTQLGSSQIYEGNFPSAISTGVYDLIARQQLGGSASETDPTIGTEDAFYWNGTSRASLTDIPTSGLNGQGLIRIYRGSMVANLPVKLVSNADHVTPFTSGIISGQISRDGGAFGALQSGHFTELGLGWFAVNLTSGDLLANTVALAINGVGISGGACDQRDLAFVLQRTSGQT